MQDEMSKAMQNRIHPVKYGRTERYSFNKIQDADIPYFIEVQKDSFNRFVKKGLMEVFQDYSPIQNHNGKVELQFVGYEFEEKSKYSVKECKDRDATFAYPLKVRVRLIDNTTGEVTEEPAYMGDIPWMTENGSFIINGAERVIVSQLVRSPGVHCDIDEEIKKKNGMDCFKTAIMPSRGAWIELEQDQNGYLNVHVDRNRKISTVFLIKAMTDCSDDAIYRLFGENYKLTATMERDGIVSVPEAKFELFCRLKAGEIPSVDAVTTYITNMFYERRRYDMLRVGRYKTNLKLNLASRITGARSAEDLYDLRTGELLVEAGGIISEEQAKRIQNCGINRVALSIFGSIDYIYDEADDPDKAAVDPLNSVVRVQGKRMNNKSQMLDRVISYEFSPIRAGQSLAERLSNRMIACNDVFDPSTGELIVAKNTIISADAARRIQDCCESVEVSPYNTESMSFGKLALNRKKYSDIIALRDIYDSETGALIVPKGGVINEAMISKINLLVPVNQYIFKCEKILSEGKASRLDFCAIENGIVIAEKNFYNSMTGEVLVSAGTEITIDLLKSIRSSCEALDIIEVGEKCYPITMEKYVFAYRIEHGTALENIVDPATGEILVEKESLISSEMARRIQDAGITSVKVAPAVICIGNNVVDLKAYLNGEYDDVNFEDLGIAEKYVYFDTIKEICEIRDRDGLSREEFLKLIEQRSKELYVRHLKIEDLLAAISYNLGMQYGFGNTDFIDHLANRRVRAVGELLQNSFATGMARLEKFIKEKMATTTDFHELTPSKIINIRPLATVIREFFGSSQLSQFMDQPNPIAELTHKRKLSALGPGGLNRERASVEVRDVNHSHYGRMCPIETPEGQNIGLITSLSTYARVNEYGFIETPYKKVIDGYVYTNEIEYLSADKEDNYIVAQANEALGPVEYDEQGRERRRFLNDRIVCRQEEDIKEVPNTKANYMDVSPKQLISVATSLIPFLENDDINRALMGSNMQRQAVPLLRPEAPIIGTGIEYRVAYDSGVMKIAKRDGVVSYASGERIEVTAEDGTIDTYVLQKFERSNQGTCINQRPIVRTGDVVKKGDVLADGPSTDNGELALGRNILIGFMTWEGYNYEDAILLSEDLVKDDVFTSIHIEEYSIEARDTRLGTEEITRDIPNVGEDMLRDIGEDGIIRIGAEVHSGDILVGKTTPKGESEPSPDEKLLKAIFGEKSKEVRDNSLKVPHGMYGVVVDIKVFSRENKDELAPGVKKMVIVSVAQKRKIGVGDKMAGRHGNKGVVSRVLPREDMPFMEDGTPLQIVLNPMGVPSRMNIGQVLEVHLGLVAKMLDWKIATPVFDGAKEEDIALLFRENGLPINGKVQLYDGRTGEPFDNKVTVGYMYMLKLIHLVDDKIHARSTGPYSLVTQQPLGGKAQFGGQRFGEMEVWALEAYGVANILQEIITVKSDDVEGRNKAFTSIINGNNVSEPGIPESFKVLLKELQSLALDIDVLTENNQKIGVNELTREEEVAPVIIPETETTSGSADDDLELVGDLDYGDHDDMLDIFSDMSGGDDALSFEQEQDDEYRDLTDLYYVDDDDDNK